MFFIFLVPLDMQGEKHLVPKLMYQISLESLVPSDNYNKRLAGLFDWGFLRKETTHCFGLEALTWRKFLKFSLL